MESERYKMFKYMHNFLFKTNMLKFSSHNSRPNENELISKRDH